MKRHLSLLLALLLVFGLISLCSCSKEDESDEVSSIEIPEDYESVSFEDSFYGISLQTALPKCESIETGEQYDGYCVYNCTVDSLNGNYYVMTVYTGVANEDAKNASYFGYDGETDVTANGDVTLVKAVKPTVGTDRETKINFFAPYLDGYASLTLQLTCSSGDMSDDDWALIEDAITEYSKLDILDTNQLVTDKGKLVDASRTMTFDNPSKISGAEATLTHTVKSRLTVAAGFTLDGVDHVIYANGDIDENRFNSITGDADAFAECTVGKKVYYCCMSNSFPDATCEVYTEIDGVYYSFTVIRCHNLDAVKNQDYVDNTDNNQFFAKLVDDFVSNAKIDTSEYKTKTY